VLRNARKPVLGIAAFSGVGKTTLLKQLLPILKAQGIRIGMIKHAHHDFDIDKPGKDSYELRKAGADRMLVVSARRLALMVENQVDKDPVLDEVLLNLGQDEVDLVLVEGFRHEDFPKIELHRTSLGHEPLYIQDKSIIAIATDGELPVPIDLPIMDINNANEIVAFIEDWLD